MADKIKKFFQNKKTDAVFKRAGPGHKLSEAAPRPESVPSKNVQVPTRAVPSDEAKQAAAAALARLDGKKRDTAAFNTSLAAIKAQVRKELEAESKQNTEKEVPSVAKSKENESTTSFLAVNGVFFRCPMVGPEILSKEDWNVKIREFLYEQLGEEQGLAAALIIHTLNKNKEKVEQCVETLCKYLENILHNPTEEKYQKIRMSNRMFQERVACMEGAQDLLLAAGFREQMLPHQDGEEQFLVFSTENVDSLDNLQVLCDALRGAEPITLELDHNLQVLLPSQAVSRNDLPPEFFALTAEELKHEMKQRSELVDRSMMLRTKAMREKEEQREMRKYRYALIRVRFPDGILLQGTFSVYNKIESVVTFVRENLAKDDLPFVLTSPTGQQLMEEDQSQTLLDAKLVPAVILTFCLDPSVDDAVKSDLETYLKPEVMVLAGEP